MPKIEVKKDSKGNERLVVNGRMDKDSYLNSLGEEGHLPWARVYNKKISADLVASRVEDLATHFQSVRPWYNVDWTKHIRDIEVQFHGWHRVSSKLAQRIERKIKFAIQPDYENWTNPYSITEYAESVKTVVKLRGISGVTYRPDDELISNGFHIECKMRRGNPVIQDELDRCNEIVRSILAGAERNLATTARKNSLTTFFPFPSEYKTACEQYLLYFIQFLEDLGIKATAELKEETHQVLFSVTPADGPAALEKIREALDIYLTLPGRADFTSASGRQTDVAVMQLQSQVQFLQSQVTLAQAAVQLKDAALQTQQTTINHLLLASHQAQPIPAPDAKPNAETEPLVGDLIEVTEVEGKGLKANLPKFLKRLKRATKYIITGNEKNLE